MTKERGISMSGWSVGRILAGAKTQTRRPMKVQPKLTKDRLPMWEWRHASGTATWGKDATPRTYALDHLIKHAPYGPVGRILYVKETFCVDEDDQSVVFYKATDCPDIDLRWTSSRFMPKKCARIWLRVTDIRAPRVQEISEADALAEGLVYDEFPVSPGNAFGILYDSIYAKSGRGFDKNQWVFAYTFERIERKDSQ